MQIFRQLDEVPSAPTVASIGNFDGVHRGHQVGPLRDYPPGPTTGRPCHGHHV